MRPHHNILAASVLLALSAASCAPFGRRSDEPIRVLVYNIHAGKDASRVESVSRIADIVKETHADVVMLQEVDNKTRRSGGVDQLAELRELTGYQGVFGKTIDYDGGEYGIAVLSRWPIRAMSMTRLPVEITDEKARANYEERGALAVRIGAPSGEIRVVDTHLDATKSDSNRVIQAQTLLRIANAQRDSGFTILGGDLNSIPSSAVVTELTAAGWKDLFTKCGTGGEFSFPADVPNRRIDYLFASNDGECRSASILDKQASDHRPVLFEVIRRH